MNTLLDTNILTRAAQPGHVMHATVVNAVDALRRRGDGLAYQGEITPSRRIASQAAIAQRKTSTRYFPDEVSSEGRIHNAGWSENGEKAADEN
jgi:hypothetical protein